MFVIGDSKDPEWFVIRRNNPGSGPVYALTDDAQSVDIVSYIEKTDMRLASLPSELAEDIERLEVEVEWFRDFREYSLELRAAALSAQGLVENKPEEKVDLGNVRRSEELSFGGKIYSIIDNVAGDEIRDWFIKEASEELMYKFFGAFPKFAPRSVRERVQNEANSGVEEDLIPSIEIYEKLEKLLLTAKKDGESWEPPGQRFIILTRRHKDNERFGTEEVVTIDSVLKSISSGTYLKGVEKTPLPTFESGAFFSEEWYSKPSDIQDRLTKVIHNIAYAHRYIKKSPFPVIVPWTGVKLEDDRVLCYVLGNRAEIYFERDLISLYITPQKTIFEGLSESDRLFYDMFLALRSTLVVDYCTSCRTSSEAKVKGDSKSSPVDDVKGDI